MPQKTDRPSSSQWFGVLLRCVPLLIGILVWGWLTEGSPGRQFIFSSPSRVTAALVNLLSSGELLRHTGITTFEAVAGFLLGTTVGILVGLGLWVLPALAGISRPYIVALGSVPVFALAPVMIVWFGIGIFSKVMMAAFSTVLVALIQAYQGAMSAEERHLRLLQVMGADRRQTFQKVVIPSALIWVVNSMKLNIGFALLGAFIGEFISSERGLGHLILKASGLYDMATVFAGCMALMAIAGLLSFLVDQFEKQVLAWRYARG